MPQYRRHVFEIMFGCLRLASSRQQGIIIAVKGPSFEIQLHGIQRIWFFSFLSCHVYVWISSYCRISQCTPKEFPIFRPGARSVWKKCLISFLHFSFGQLGFKGQHAQRNLQIRFLFVFGFWEIFNWLQRSGNVTQGFNKMRIVHFWECFSETGSRRCSILFAWCAFLARKLWTAAFLHGQHARLRLFFSIRRYILVSCQFWGIVCGEWLMLCLFFEFVKRVVETECGPGLNFQDLEVCFCVAQKFHVILYHLFNDYLGWVLRCTRIRMQFWGHGSVGFWTKILFSNCVGLWGRREFGRKEGKKDGTDKRWLSLLVEVFQLPLQEIMAARLDRRFGWGLGGILGQGFHGHLGGISTRTTQKRKIIVRKGRKCFRVRFWNKSKGWNEGGSSRCQQNVLEHCSRVSDRRGCF